MKANLIPMKTLFLYSFILLLAFSAKAQVSLQVALSNPQAAQQIQLSGNPTEVNVFIRNAPTFTALQALTISGLNDSLLGNRLCKALQPMNTLTYVYWDNCLLTRMPEGFSRLNAVKSVRISGCYLLNMAVVYAQLRQMPSLEQLDVEVNEMDLFPASFSGLRHLTKIHLTNNDKSLADGYAANMRGLNALRTTETKQLGFDEAGEKNSSLRLEYTCFDAAVARTHLDAMLDVMQGAVGATGVLVLPARLRAFDRKHPFVNRPFAGIDVLKNVYVVDAARGTKIDYPSGTKITIPTNAFVDKNGSPVNGIVALDYREFRDVADVIVSGITMHYDSGGVSGQFKSAGMFEMNASVNGQEVFLAPNKKVEMQFAVTDSSSAYNFYELDEKLGWVYKGKPGEKTEVREAVVQNPVTLTKAMLMFKSLQQRRLPKIGDTTHFDERFEDLSYAYLTKRKDTYDKKGKLKFIYGLQRINLRKTGSGKNCTYFTISFVKWPNHRELGIYSPYTWCIDQKMNAKSFKAMYGKNVEFVDARVKYEGGQHTLVLKNRFGFKEIPVKLGRMRDKKFEPVSKTNADRLHRGYVRQLSICKRSFERSITKEKKTYAKRMLQVKKDSLKVWNTIREEMTAEEKSMTTDEWFAEYKRILNIEISAMDSLAGNLNNVLRSLTLTGFGVYNCDQIQRLDRPVEVFTILNTPEAPQGFNAQTIYVIDKRDNSVLTYYAGGYGTIAPKAKDKAIWTAFSPYSQNTMLGVDDKGNMAVVKSEGFDGRNFTRNREEEFDANLTTGNASTVADIRKLIFD
jgi:hypothetical protein